MKPARGMRRWLAVALLGAAALHAAAAVPVTIAQRLGAALPLDLTFVDAEGRGIRLGDAFAGGRAVVLVFGYYRCADLCGLAMHGVLEALDASGLPRRAYRVVGIGIDPTETPADALARRTVYLGYADHLRERRAVDAPLDLRLLVGAPAAVASLARQAGFGDAVDDRAPGGVRHAAGFVVVTPDGRTSRHFDGVRFDPREVRLALVDAGAGGIGTLADRLLLLCSHVDPATGRRSGAVMNLLRAVCAALALGLGGWVWRMGRRPPAASVEASGEASR